jgi:hypothetical protein
MQPVTKPSNPFSFMAKIPDGSHLFQSISDEIVSTNAIALRTLYPFTRKGLTKGMCIPAMIFDEDGFSPNFDNLAEPDVFYIVESSDCYTATLFKGFDFGHHTKDDGSFQAYNLDTRDDDFPPEVCIEIQPDQRIMILSQAAVSRIPVSSAPQSIKDRILALGGLQGPTPLPTPQDSFSFDKGSQSTSSTERTIHNTTTFFRRLFGTEGRDVEMQICNLLGPNKNPKTDQAVANLQSRLPVNSFTKNRTVAANKHNAHLLMTGFFAVDSPAYNVVSEEFTSMYHQCFQTREALKKAPERTIADIATETISLFRHLSAMVDQPWSRENTVRFCSEVLIDQLELRDGHEGSGLQHCKLNVIDDAVAKVISEFSRFANNQATLSLSNQDFAARARTILTLPIDRIIRDSSLPTADLHQTKIRVTGLPTKTPNTNGKGNGKRGQIVHDEGAKKKKALKEDVDPPKDKTWTCSSCNLQMCGFDLRHQLKTTTKACTLGSDCKRCHCKVDLPLSQQKKADLLTGLSESGLAESFKKQIRSLLV